MFCNYGLNIFVVVVHCSLDTFSYSFLHFPLVATIFWIRSNVIVVTDNDVVGCYKAVYVEYMVWSDVIHFFKSEGVIECEILASAGRQNRRFVDEMSLELTQS